MKLTVRSFLLVMLFSFYFLLLACGGGGGNSLPKQAEKSVSQLLEITFGGDGGNGTVKLSTGKSCKSIDGGCIETITTNTQVILESFPDNISTFNGFQGDSDCTDFKVTMSTAKKCKAIFNINTSLTNFNFTIAISGLGTGTITSTAGNINCTTTGSAGCSGRFLKDSKVVLIPQPATNSIFGGWTGVGCSSNVTMDSAKSCTATFDLKQAATQLLSITKLGSGSGTITSTPTGITCGTDCSGIFDQGSIVSFTIQTAQDSLLAGWTGVGCGNSMKISNMATAICTMTFDLKTPTVLPWTGTKQLGVAGAHTIGDGISIDSQNNVYVAGYTAGGLDGNSSVGGASFITKYNSSGIKKWTKLHAGGTQNSIAIDSQNYIYIAGITNRNLGGNTLTGRFDFFVTKYNSTGSIIWIKQLGVALVDTVGRSVSIDSRNNIYVTGYTEGGLDGNRLIGVRDFFITKFNSSGTRIWTKQSGVALGQTTGTGIAIDSLDNVYVTGATSGGLDGNILMGSSDFFVTKYDSSGIKIWTKQYGVASSTRSAGANGISIDSRDNIYVTGSTNGGLVGTNITGIGTNDIFVTKYDSSGVRGWTKQLGVAPVDTVGYAISIDSLDNVYVTGYTSGGLDGNVLMGSSDFFVTKYSSAGIKQWTKQNGAASATTYGQGISIDNQDNVFVTGRTNKGLDGNSYISTSSSNFFITKFNSLGIKQ